MKKIMMLCSLFSMISVITCADKSDPNSQKLEQLRKRLDKAEGKYHNTPEWKKLSKAWKRYKLCQNAHGLSFLSDFDAEECSGLWEKCRLVMVENEATIEYKECELLKREIARLEY